MSQIESVGDDLEVMTLRQAAERTGLSATTLRRYIKSGRLRARLIPGRYGPEYVVDDNALEIAGVTNDEDPIAAAPSAALARASTVAPQPVAAAPPAAFGGDLVPGIFYRELLMKHEQLLVQLGALRVSGQQLYEVRQEAERRAREAKQAAEDLEHIRNRHAKEIGTLKAQLRRALLELAEKDDETRRLRDRIRDLEMSVRNAATAESIEDRFARTLRGTLPTSDH